MKTAIFATLGMSIFILASGLPQAQASQNYNSSFERARSQKRNSQLLQIYRQSVAKFHGQRVAQDMKGFINSQGRLYGVGSIYVCEAKHSYINDNLSFISHPFNGICMRKSDL